MRAESIVFTIAGICFGVILGWVLGTQQAQKSAAATAAVVTAPAPAAAETTPGSTQQRTTLDDAKVQSLKTILASDPNNARAAVELANTYFDSEQYIDAIAWYETALKNDPKNVDASTDLGVAYYYANRPDQALQQFNRSLALDPKHTKTLLNQGIVMAFGKEDLAGATAAWQKVIDVAPNSPEATAATRALEGVAAAHKNGAPGS